MAKIHYVKKCRVDNPAVKRGEGFYWWKLPFGEKQYSKTYPSRSQLTDSDYLGCVFDLQDSIKGYTWIEQEADFSDMMDEIIDQVTDIRDQCQLSYDNMAPMLHSAPNGLLLMARIDACDTALGEVSEMDFDSAKFDDEEQFITDTIDVALMPLEITLSKGKVVAHDPAATDE